jgi:hypothetical protein
MRNRQILRSLPTPRKSATKNQGPKNNAHSHSEGCRLIFVIPSDTRSTKSEKPPMNRTHPSVSDVWKKGWDASF